ncbi:sialic acid-binding Ig-like lectin 12 isoform X2 [Heptranchias perlo]|uniref:sialic acid-binding Ig-like lectin 12 isoform X2 n=1 Tax=Heptranchias perlo TaxID=212740 RepID=UPI00355A34BB
MLCILFCALAMSLSAERLNKNGWSMETPDRVTGRERKSTVLFCKFTHPYPGYKGNITVTWRRNMAEVVFSYTNYPSRKRQSSGSENLIHQNVGERYRLMGNPRENDASIMIQSLRKVDTEERYNCRVDFKEKEKGKFQLIHGVLKITADRNNIWQVTVNKGDSATLPCTFSPPDQYPSNITVLWMKENPWKESVVFSQTRSLRDGSDSVTVNKGERYQLIGDPTQGDASIRMRDLGLNDTSKYFCHVHVKNGDGENVTQDEMRLQVVADRNNIWRVTVNKGDSAALPCTFSPPDQYPSNITVLWMKENPWKESVVFSQTRSLRDGSDSVTVNKGERYQLIGDPTQGDASIRMRDLGLNDTSKYFCHVHVKNGDGENVTQDEMRLQVVAPATILELSVVTDNITGDTIVCKVEGEPPANITWIDPENSALPGNSTTVTQLLEKHQTVGEILNPTLRGNYRCVAVNEHGRDVRQIHLWATERDMLTISLYIGSAILFILLVLIGFTVWRLKKNPQEPGSVPVHSVVNDAVSQQAETDPQESESLILYSSVHVLRFHQTETGVRESESTLYSTVNTPKLARAQQTVYENCSTRASEDNPQEAGSVPVYSIITGTVSQQAETAAIYAAVVKSTKQN